MRWVTDTKSGFDTAFIIGRLKSLLYQTHFRIISSLARRRGIYRNWAPVPDLLYISYNGVEKLFHIALKGIYRLNKLLVRPDCAATSML